MTNQRATLIIAGNSLGQPIDLPTRSKQALIDSDLLIFEEDRPARAALKAAGIHRPYIKLNEHDQKETLDQAKQMFQKGKSICYMSDQGMPNLADPGQSLLKLAYKQKAKVIVIPGPSSVSAALAACPFFEKEFVFRDFLNKDETIRLKQLTQIKNSPIPSVVLETPYRRNKLLNQFSQLLEPTRPILLALDISGPEEEFLAGPIKEVIAASDKIQGKLNFVIIIDAKPTTLPHR